MAGITRFILQFEIQRRHNSCVVISPPIPGKFHWYSSLSQNFKPSKSNKRRPLARAVGAVLDMTNGIPAVVHGGSAQGFIFGDRRDERLFIVPECRAIVCYR
jgi:hypothetical protein